MNEKCEVDPLAFTVPDFNENLSVESCMQSG